MRSLSQRSLTVPPMAFTRMTWQRAPCEITTMVWPRGPGMQSAWKRGVDLGPPQAAPGADVDLAQAFVTDGVQTVSGGHHGRGAVCAPEIGRVHRGDRLVRQ